MCMTQHATDDPRKRPYARPQPFGMMPDLVTAGAIDIDDPQGFWVPQAEGVWFRPLVLSVSQGFYVNLLRVRRAGVLSRHRHFGAVHAFVLRGRWRYLEHDWEATEGSYVFEPPGETHTLVVPDAVDDMVTLFHVTGGYAYVGLPKEGEPDIEIPALFVSVPYPGISAADSERLLVKVMETEMSDEISVSPDAKTQFKVNFRAMRVVPSMEHLNAIKARMESARTLALEPYAQTSDPDEVEAAAAAAPARAPAGKRKY
jgi:quercetin dioxygenase-like cupin family protein